MARPRPPHRKKGPRPPSREIKKQRDAWKLSAERLDAFFGSPERVRRLVQRTPSGRVMRLRGGYVLKAKVGSGRRKVIKYCPRKRNEGEQQRNLLAIARAYRELGIRPRHYDLRVATYHYANKAGVMANHGGFLLWELMPPAKENKGFMRKMGITKEDTLEAGRELRQDLERICEERPWIQMDSPPWNAIVTGKRGGKLQLVLIDQIHDWR